MPESLVWAVVLCVLTVVIAGCGRGGSDGDTLAGSNAIRVLSNRADLISGGDALIEIAIGDHVDAMTPAGAEVM